MNSGARTLRFDQQVLNASASQLDRVRAAPRPDAVRVDGRTVAQLLAFAARYGALVRFYDLDDLPRGDWSEFFAADPAVVEALHGALDLPEIEDTLGKLLEQARAARTPQHRVAPLRRLIGGIVRLIGILDRQWPGLQGEAQAEQQLQRLVRSRRTDAVTVHLEAVRVHWSAVGGLTWTVMDIEIHGQPWIDGLLSRLEDLLAGLMQSLRLGAEAALAASAASLQVRGHAPQAALYNAFILLFVQARKELNRFPGRLLNFYYADILEQHLRPAEPDFVYLTFTLGANTPDTAIPRGTLFLAGTDAQGDPIQYAADTSLEVTPVAVTSMSVHRLTYLEGSLAVATGVLSGAVAPIEPGGVLPAPFPLFGRDQAGTYGALTLQPASLGFIVSNPLLMLTGGTRTVRMNLTHAAADDATTDSMASGDVLAGVAQPAFALYYTTAGGWVKVQSFTVTPGTADTTSAAPAITFTFTLPPDAPALVALSTPPGPNSPPPDLAADAFPCAADCPSLVATLLQRPDAAAGGQPGHRLHFAILSLIELAQITLDVSVQGLAPAALTGANGPLDPGQNFAVFGLQPAQYTTLTVSSPELFVKPLSSLQVIIDWAGLPVTSTGFQGYYQGYRINADGQFSAEPLFDNTSFTANFGLVSPGSWTLDAGANYYLFQTEGSATGAGGPPPAPAAPVLMTSTLVVAGIAPATVPDYYNPEASALSLTLASPSYAFGNVLYASNLSAAASNSVSTLRARATGDIADRQGAATQIANAASVNATATDKDYAQALDAAISQALSALNGKALALLQQVAADAQAGASTAEGDGTGATWQQDLQAALSGVSATPAQGLGSRLAQLAQGVRNALAKAPDAATVTARLQSWLAANQAALTEAGANAALMEQAQALLAASANLAAAQAAAAGQPVAVARTTVSAALQQARATVDAADANGARLNAATLASVLPNAPWLPMVSSFTLSYTASGSVALQALVPDSTAQTDETDETADAADASAQSTSPGFLHLRPFDQIALPKHGPGKRVTLLPRVARHCALYIDLSAPAAQVSLLFILRAGPDGWSNEAPVVLWEQRLGDAWLRVKVMGDSTNGLLNSGIVTLALRARSHVLPEVPPQLRVRLIHGMNHSPLVCAVIANALSATWVPPGGAEQRGQPLPAGSITQMVTPITGIATISQPMNSIGGSPPAAGPGFDLWMAERLRHKGFAVNAWDYARIVLAAVPTLWQLGVVPATDESTGHTAAGRVWVVAVAGPNTPNVDDPTMPLVDPTVLAEIGELLEGVTSPFLSLTVTNPPWVPLRVDADLVFTDDDTVDASQARLQDDLVRWLSPWPDPTLGLRPADYFTREAVAVFIRQRSYVLGITSLELVAQAGPAKLGWHYMTSAKKHRLRGIAAPAKALP